MRAHSYTIIHYGKDYIGYALQSISNQVEKSHVIYTATPSHGHQTSKPPIESLGEIQQAVFLRNKPDKIRLYELKNIQQEGQQRDLAVKTCIDAGAELILVVDCDEIWNDETLEKALDYVWQQNSARDWLINFTHFWRSFSWVCRDEGWPVRIIDTRHSEGVGYVPKEFGEIYHFGYAVTDEVMRYKWEIHGHKGELRPEWFDAKWGVWPPLNDCHPTNDKEFWNPESFDPSLLPELMYEHPFYDLEMVE
jgi:hypothetical protein